MTIKQALVEGTALLLQSGITDARWQAELLLRSALRVSRARFFASLDEPLDAASWQLFSQWIAARQGGTPVQYLTGQQEFMGLTLRVTPAVLIPRPDTEVLVTEALRLLADQPGARVAELATGSGAIALALAAQLSQVEIVATDISPSALAVAAQNAERLGLAERIAWRLGCWTEPLAGLGPWQAIVSNPPYIRSADIPTLGAEVQAEPHLALDGGPDGLACYRQLIPSASNLLAPGGHLLLEIGAGQAAAVRQLLAAAGLASIYTLPDLAGIPRVVIGCKGDGPFCTPQ